ncbi:hypothetical protein QJS10_CPA02g00938 [Acorus calamus]|uniref:DUF4283 domain-containing protein n=1 Tax=Acorus calamus TaxID=4465 RepID=A0AAV9FEW7_ACOCL|nr:hypothetical protein QJS10_CPA02g00938 [Acorus calamus]
MSGSGSGSGRREGGGGFSGGLGRSYGAGGGRNVRAEDSAGNGGGEWMLVGRKRRWFPGGCGGIKAVRSRQAGSADVERTPKEEPSSQVEASEFLEENEELLVVKASVWVSIGQVVPEVISVKLDGWSVKVKVELMGNGASASYAEALRGRKVGRNMDGHASVGASARIHVSCKERVGDNDGWGSSHVEGRQYKGKAPEVSGSSMSRDGSSGSGSGIGSGLGKGKAVLMSNQRVVGSMEAIGAQAGGSDFVPCSTQGSLSQVAPPNVAPTHHISQRTGVVGESPSREPGPFLEGWVMRFLGGERVEEPSMKGDGCPNGQHVEELVQGFLANMMGLSQSCGPDSLGGQAHSALDSHTSHAGGPQDNRLGRGSYGVRGVKGMLEPVQRGEVAEKYGTQDRRLKSIIVGPLDSACAQEGMDVVEVREGQICPKDFRGVDASLNGGGCVVSSPPCSTVGAREELLEAEEFSGSLACGKAVLLGFDVKERLPHG